MHWQNDQYVLSQHEVQQSTIHCPQCSATLEPKTTAVFAGFVCSNTACSFASPIEQVSNLPEAVLGAFKESINNSIDIEAMKDVVDELMARGSHDIAEELNSVILANTSSETVASAEEVEAIRLLNFVQAQAEQDPKLQKLAARLAILKSELTRRK